MLPSRIIFAHSLHELNTIIRNERARAVRLGNKQTYEMNGTTKKKNINLQILPKREFVQKLDKEKIRSSRTGTSFSLVGYRLNGISVSSLKKLVRIVRRRMRAADEIGWIADDRIGVFLAGSDSVGGEVFAVCVDEALYGYKNNNNDKEYDIFIEHFSPSTLVDKRQK